MRFLWTLKRFWRARRAGELRPETERRLRETTLIVKTFERPETLEFLVDSLDRHYGAYGHALTILVADDSASPSPPKFPSRNRVVHFPLPFDQGVSYGRNYLLGQVRTPYFLLLDDDFYLTGETRIEEFVRLMEENRDLDILGGLVYNRGRKPIRSSFTIRFKDGVLEKFRKPSGERDGISFYDMVANFFIAKTEIAKKVRWREELKLAEHTAFFLDCQKARLKVGYCEAVKINHERIAGAEYKRIRKDRGKEYGALFRELYGIREIYEDGIRK